MSSSERAGAAEAGEARVRSRPKTPRLPSAVLEAREVGHSVLALRVSRPDGFEFSPGQRVKLNFAGLKRPYNISSPPSDAFLEFCVERVNDGVVSPRLFELKTGDPLLVKARAKGKLTLCPSATEHLMVASVTGIAPFRSMVRHALEHPSAGATPHFTLLHGGAHAEELVYGEELTALSRAHPDRLTYIPVVSDPSHVSNTGFEAATGHVSAAASPFADQLDPTKTQVYACGHPAMIADIRLAFCRRDFPFVSEAFWKL